jgi:imidazolonepropionase-like amidohydrolase
MKSFLHKTSTLKRNCRSTSAKNINKMSKKININRFFALFLAVICQSFFWNISVSAQTPKVIVLKAARMLDVKAGNIVNNPVVIIENGRIKDVGEKLMIPKNAEMIDLGDVTLLPGLIDAHTHLLENYDSKIGGDDPNMILTVVQLGTTKRALLGAAMGREMLEAGFTIVRDVGNSGVNGDVALRDAIRAGWVQGPRIVASTRALSPTGGQFGGMAGEVQKLIEQEYVVINGADEARRAVRQALYDGADCIKIIVNNGSAALSLEEVKAIVEEAHRAGKKVAAHAIGDSATRIAAEAGVDSIEHAYVIPDDVLKMMAEKKIFLVPTDAPPEFFLSLYGFTSETSPEFVKQMTDNTNEFVKNSRERLNRAIKFGVKIAAGSDEYYQFTGKTRGESSKAMFRAYRAAGMSALDIIQAATINSAELLAGANAEFGLIEKGKYADIIAVSGDILKDVTVLEKVSFVMKGGKIIKK